MKFRLPPRRDLFAMLVSGAMIASSAALQAQAPTSEAAANAAQELMNSGKLPEAAAAFEDVIKKYPTSTLVPDTQYRLANLYNILGEYDKCRSLIDKITRPPSPDDIVELGFGLLPQMLAAKAEKEKTDAARKAGYESALKEYDAFLQKYPASTQVENIVYSRALAYFQIAQYDKASETLRDNLKAFPKSETIHESQMLLAISEMTRGCLLAQATPGEANPQADTAFTEGERLLADIITRRPDLGIVNDAQLHLGELYANRALFAPTEAQAALFEKALHAYRNLMPKEAVLAAQEERVKRLRDRRLAALQAKNIAQMKVLDGMADHEVEKLAALKAKGDLSLTAQIKVGQLFLQNGACDEARLVFREMQPFAQADDQKKTLQYYLTLSYAQQAPRLPAETRPAFLQKAVASYDTFQQAYKGDELAENLPYTIGSLFLATNPSKALHYYQEQIAIYPKGRLTTETLLMQARALVALKQFDKALATFQNFLKENPKRDVAAAAQLGVADILRENGRVDEALSEYGKIATAYKGLPQAEIASFFVPKLQLDKGANELAINGFTEFLKNFPKSEQGSMAKYSLAQGYGRKGDPANAMRLFKEVATDYPKSEAAPYAYFEQLALLQGADKAEARTALMREFLQRYPESDKVYYAYNSLAQDQLAAKQTPEAITIYNEMVHKHSSDPLAALALFNLTALWTGQANALGQYYGLNDTQRAVWTSAIDNSMAAAEKLIASFPGNEQLPNVLQYVVLNQKLLANAKLKTDDDITAYFKAQADKASEPQTRSKILFTLASFTYEKDKEKALEQMKAAYNPGLLYAPADLDLYANALLDTGRLPDATAVFNKLAADYPLPDPAHPEKAPAQIQQAQGIALFGQAKVLQKQQNTAAAAEKFETFKRLYPNFSPAKVLEANYGIALAAHEAKQDDKAGPLLIQIFRTPAAAIDLRANAMLLHAKIQEDKNELAPAIDENLKIALFFDSVPAVAAEGLWRGAQLLEKQAANLPQTSQNPKDPTKPAQLQKALKAYKDLVSKYPTAPHVAEAKVRISALEPK
ncbi:MAG: tetratricopeptide repeat protein [Chthoniobacteraceae bacterium]